MLPLILNDGDEVILSKKAIKAAPGEMEELTLPSDVVSKIKGDSIKIGLEVR